MNTCKAALRIAWQHKLYLLIYMVGLGTLMLVMGSSAISSNDGSGSGVDSFQVATPRIAVINTDGGALGDGLRDYLAQTSTIVTLHDDAQSLQDAVARNDVDLIATIPAGYSSRFEEAAANGERPPTINTAVSYTSGKGSLTKIDVDGYFTQLRNTLSSGLRADMTSAVDYTVQQGARSDLRAGITVVQTKSQSGKSLSNGFGMVMKLSVYPLFTALTVCVSLLIGVFNSRETSRRITASPLRSFIFSGQQLLACLLIGLICWFYTAVPHWRLSRLTTRDSLRSDPGRWRFRSSRSWCSHWSPSPSDTCSGNSEYRPLRRTALPWPSDWC